MNPADTVKAITTNLVDVVEAQGIGLSSQAMDEGKNIPASLLPLAEIAYLGERFEYTHGQRAGYAEVEYLLRVFLHQRDALSLMTQQQTWVHRIREALTVESLNQGGLSTSRPVTRVDLKGVRTERKRNLSVINYRIVVRYREG